MDYIKELETYRDLRWQMMLRTFHHNGDLKAARYYIDQANIIDDCISFLRLREAYPESVYTTFDDEFSDYKYGEWMHTREREKEKERKDK